MGRFYRRFWPFVRAQRWLIGGGFAALIAQILLRLLEPWPLKFVIDEIVKANPEKAVELPFYGAANTDTVIIVAAIALVLVTGLRSLTSYWSKVSFAVAGNSTLTRIRAKLFTHMQLLSLDFHNQARGGDLVARVVGDVGMVKEVTVNAVMPLLASLLVMSGMLAVMLWLNVTLTLVIVAMAPVLWFLTSRRSSKIGRVARKNRHREGAIAATTAETLTAIKTVQTLAIQDQISERFAEHNNASMRQGAKVAKLSAGLERSVDLLIAVGTAVALWFGAQQVLKSALTPGELLVFLFYLKRGFRPMRDYAKYSARLAKASAAAERVIEILDQIPRENDSSNGQPAPNFSGLVAFDSVSFNHSDGSMGLEDANFIIEPGETVLIVGPSGSGKSTLLNLLMRLYSPQSGTISVDGIDIATLNAESYRNQFNVVLQDGLLFTSSVRDNIALLRPEATDEEVIEAARLAHAHEFIERLPDGYDTVIGERGVSLSRGQRQRLAIARAAIRAAPILVFDEPTTGLDTVAESAVITSIESLSRGMTTFIVAHRPPDGLSVDRLLVVRNGRLSEYTDVSAAMAGDARFHKLFEVDSPTEMNTGIAS